MGNEIFSSNFEVAFLNLLMRHPELIHDVSTVKVGMFSSTPNQIIFATLKELSAQSLAISEKFLIDYLKSKNKLALASGEAYIKYLYEQSFSIENFLTYSSMMVDAYRTRMVLSSTSEVESLLASGTGIDNVILDLKTKLELLNGHDIGKTTFRLSESLESVWKEIVARTANPGLTGISTGFRSFDVYCGGYPAGDFWVLGARPSQGKTALMCNSVLAASTNKGVPLVFSLEMNKQTFVERFLAISSETNLSSIRLGTMNQDEVDAVYNSLSILKELPIFVDTSFTIDVSYVTTVIRNYVKNFGVNIVWIDYIQLMSERNVDQTAELGRISRAMKLLAKDLNIFIGVVAQLNRAVEMRDDKRPILSDLRQSGNLEEDADLVAFLYRDDYYYSDSKNKGLMEFIIRKHRNGPR